MKTPRGTSREARVRGQMKLAELSAQVEAALKLLDSETADGIIGMPPGEEYDTLIQGASAVMEMQWAMMKSHGLRENRGSVKAGGQALTMVLTLMHYAYALGVRRGRAEGGEAEGRGSGGAENG